MFSQSITNFRKANGHFEELNNIFKISATVQVTARETPASLDKFRMCVTWKTGIVNNIIIDL